MSRLSHAGGGSDRCCRIDCAAALGCCDLAQGTIHHPSRPTQGTLFPLQFRSHLCLLTLLFFLSLGWTQTSFFSGNLMTMAGDGSIPRFLNMFNLIKKYGEIVCFTGFGQRYYVISGEQGFKDLAALVRSVSQAFSSISVHECISAVLPPRACDCSRLRRIV